MTEDISRGAVEALVGQKLSDLPAHEDLYASVLSLGGGNWDEAVRPLFESFPVDRLPVPHIRPVAITTIDSFASKPRSLPSSTATTRNNLLVDSLFVPLDADDRA